MFLRTKLTLAAAAVALLLPVSAAAGDNKPCPPPEPVTPESYTWDFPAETDQILHEIEMEAYEVRSSADRLEMLARNPMSYSPVTHGMELNRTREHVNNISEKMCRLHKIRRVSENWQQTAINNVWATVQHLVSDAEHAIRVFNDRESLAALYGDSYGEAVKALYDHARDLCHCTEVVPES